MPDEEQKEKEIEPEAKAEESDYTEEDLDVELGIRMLYSIGQFSI